jgi:nicotinate-nucleotide adenylyltransferase
MGHLILGEAAREQLGLDLVLFVPTGQPWRKAGREISAAVDRLTMVRLAIEDNPAFEASPIEIEREGPSYSYETLEALANDNPGAELYLILGADALADLPNWRSPQRIVELATLAVAFRAAAGGADESDATLAGLQARVTKLSMPEIGISASGVREHVAHGRSTRYLVTPAVGAYIEAKNLYRRN